MDGPCRLYLITPPVITDLEAFAASLGDALAGGPVAAVQLRLKADQDSPPNPDDVRRAAEILAPIVRKADALFIINDDPMLAKETRADGVHVGQSDTSLSEARDILGTDAVVGVTCHASTDLAIEAGEGGADYVAFGAFFPTSTKEAPIRPPISLIENWTLATKVPCVAIGGITTSNAEPLIKAGADYLAVSAGVWRAPEGPKAAVAHFTELFSASE